MLRWPGIPGLLLLVAIFVRPLEKGLTPQSADADSSPYRGAFRGGRRLIKPPLQGEVSPKVAEGCIATLRRRYPANPARTLPYVS